MNADYKVLHVIPFYSDRFGGPTMMLKELAYYFEQKGLSVDIVTTNVNSRKDNTPLNTWIEDESSGRLQVFNSPVKLNYYMSPGIARWLWKHLKDYDLVHFHCPFSFPAIYGSILASLFRIPFILSPHGNFNPWAIDYKGTKKQRFMKFGGRRLYSKASCIHILSETARQSIESMDITAPMRLIPNGVGSVPENDPEELRSLFHERFQTVDKVTFTFLGRLDPQKGLERLIEAFTPIYKKHPDSVRLILAGPDLIGYKSTIFKYLDRFDCKAGVLLPGMIRGKEKAALLKYSDVFCLTSHSEGNSIALLEAMSYGKACIVSEECNMKQASQDGALIQLGGEKLIENFTETMEDLYQHKEKRDALGSLAIEYVQGHHNWLVITEKFLTLYQDVVEKKLDADTSG